jgi:hypothetical protein
MSPAPKTPQGTNGSLTSCILRLERITPPQAKGAPLSVWTGKAMFPHSPSLTDLLLLGALNGKGFFQSLQLGLTNGDVMPINRKTFWQRYSLNVLFGERCCSAGRAKSHSSICACEQNMKILVTLGIATSILLAILVFLNQTGMASANPFFPPPPSEFMELDYCDSPTNATYHSDNILLNLTLRTNYHADSLRDHKCFYVLDQNNCTSPHPQESSTILLQQTGFMIPQLSITTCSTFHYQIWQKAHIV